MQGDQREVEGASELTALGLALTELETRMVFQLRRLAVRHGNELGGFSGLVIRDEEVAALLDELRGDAAHGHEAPRPFSLARAEPAIGSEPTDLLLRMGRTFGLSEFETFAVVTAMAVELDGRYARLIAYLNDNATKTRPSVALTLQLLRPLEVANPLALACFLPDGPLRRYGLLTLEGEGPLMDLTPVVPADLWPRLLGLPADLCGELRFPELRHALEALILPPSVVARAKHFVRLALSRGRAKDAVALAIVGPAGSGRAALARSIAWAQGRPALQLRWASCQTSEQVTRVLRDARWHDAVVVIDLTDATAEPCEQVRDLLRTRRASFIWVASRIPPWLHEVNPELCEMQLERPETSARTLLWRQALPEPFCSDAVLGRVAQHYRLGPEKIARAAQLARTDALLENANSCDTMLARACQAVCDVDFGAMAQRLPCPFTRDDLVVPARVWVELEYILAWHRHHRQLTRDWGYDRRIPNAYGLACLLSGGPGTGKTLAAQVIANELALPLYRIDLSQVVNKYIGETEKNLSRAFDAAYEAHAVLFFDEADALFGKRTKTRDAHDRYANIETGYLLQRLEAHEGITILATNLPGNLDEAFTRRFQVTADFPMPGPRERAQIWDRLLPPRQHRADGLDISTLGDRFEFSGGEIKNAALAAALFAARDGSAVTLDHALTAARREMSKAGRVVS